LPGENDKLSGFPEDFGPEDSQGFDDIASGPPTSSLDAAAHFSGDSGGVATVDGEQAVKLNSDEFEDLALGPTDSELQESINYKIDNNPGVTSIEDFSVDQLDDMEVDLGSQ
jgi:hypothetical protein